MESIASNQSLDMDLGALSTIGGMKTMNRGRSQSGPSPMIQKKLKPLLVNEIYSLKGVPSKSIRLEVNREKYTILDLKNYIRAKFQIPRTSKMYVFYVEGLPDDSLQ